MSWLSMLSMQFCILSGNYRKLPNGKIVFQGTGDRLKLHICGHLDGIKEAEAVWRRHTVSVGSKVVDTSIMGLPELSSMTTWSHRRKLCRCVQWWNTAHLHLKISWVCRVGRHVIAGTLVGVVGERRKKLIGFVEFPSGQVIYAIRQYRLLRRRNGDRYFSEIRWRSHRLYWMKKTFTFASSHLSGKLAKDMRELIDQQMGFFWVFYWSGCWWWELHWAQPLFSTVLRLCNATYS